MASLVLSGDTSGSITVSAPAVAGSTTQTLVNVTGTLAPIVSGTAVTASGTSVDFTGIPSWVKRITVMFNGVSISGTSSIQTQLGTSGGVQTTGYNSNAAQLANGAGVSVLASTTGFVNNAASAAQAYSGQYIFSLLDSSSGLWVLHGAVGVDGTATLMTTTGKKTLSGTLDRVRITTVNGTDTFDAGTINLLWE